jgi:signal peptidase II
MKKITAIIAINATALAVIDQCVKWMASLYLAKPVVFASWLQLRFEKNYGIAWGIQLPFELLMFLNIVLLILIPVLAWKHLDLRRWMSQLALILIIGGALGNIYDRLVNGYVVDYFSVGSWPVFNLADAFLTIGVFLTLVFYGKIKRVH